MKKYFVAVPVEYNTYNFGCHALYAIQIFKNLSDAKKEANRWGGTLVGKIHQGRVYKKTIDKSK